MKKADLENPFVITSVCRKDLVDAGIPRKVVATLSDEDMKAIAQRMGEMYVEYGSFWENIRESFEILQVQPAARQANTPSQESM